MFGKLFKAKGPAVKESKSEVNELTTEQGSIEHFNPKLINKLKKQHRDLERLFGLMVKYANEGNIKSLHNCKREFNATLLGHLGIENSILYRHIQYHYRTEPDVIALMKEFKSEMRDIQKALTGFFVQWPDQNALSADLPKFKAGLTGIGDALNVRIGSEEETLYEIYENIAELDAVV